MGFFLYVSFNFTKKIILMDFTIRQISFMLMFLAHSTSLIKYCHNNRNEYNRIWVIIAVSTSVEDAAREVCVPVCVCGRVHVRCVRVHVRVQVRVRVCVCLCVCVWRTRAALTSLNWTRPSSPSSEIHAYAASACRKSWHSAISSLLYSEPILTAVVSFLLN